MEASEFMARKMSEFSTFKVALREESDRGCVLFAGSYLDEELMLLLKANLIQMSEASQKEADKSLFTGTSPLSSFSSRISLSYYLGLISSDMKRELDLIRKIRNDFAHSAKAISFESPAVASRCRELKYSYWEKSHRPRGHFTASVTGVLAQMHHVEMTSERPLESALKAPTEQAKGIQRAIIDTLKRNPSEA